MEKAFGKTETNAQFFYELLHGEDGGLSDDKIDGTLPEALAGGPAAQSVSGNNPADQQLQGHEVVAAAFNRLTKYYPKITEHFQKLGLDLTAMLGADGTLKPAFVAQVRDRLAGKDATATKSALSYQSAQLYIAEREGISTRDPLFAEKFQALMDKPQAERDAELKKFFAEPKNAGKLVRWAFRYSEFSLLPFKDQVEVFQAAGFDEAVVKAELAPLWQGRSLPKLVAQAALLKGLELEEAAKGLEGDAAQKKLQEARYLFRAAVELDNRNPLARRRLSTHLMREGKMEGASFHLAEAVKHETEVRYMVEIAQGLAIGDKRLLAGHADPWAFVADNLVSVQRFAEAAGIYHEAAKAATARGDHPASLAFTEKELKIDETAKPMALQFSEKQNPIATAFYKALRAQGVPGQLIDGANADAAKAADRKVEAGEVFAYLDAHWKDERVQRALQSINFPALPWEASGAKPPYVDAAFEKLPFADKMAAWHDYEIGLLKKEQPLDEGLLEKRLRLASFYQPAKPERHKALGDLLLQKQRYAEAVTAYRAADAAAGSADLELKTSLGHALFGAGDFKAARDMYTLGLERNPKDVKLLKLRFEANEYYIATLDPAKDADALKAATAEHGADGALVLALGAKDEKAKLADLEKLLSELHGGDGDKARTVAALAGLKPEELGGITKKDAIAAVEGLAQKYLSLAEQAYADPKDAELVRAELNGLAAECFQILSRFAAADGDPEVQRMAKVYEGYALIAEGKIDEGVAVLTPLRKIPQADRILTHIEKGRMRLVNLSAVEAWELYNKDMERAETDSAKGWMSGTSVSSVTEKWAKERAIAAAVKEKLTAGDADSMEAALKLIAESGEESLKERAKYYLSTESRANGTGPIGDLVAYASGNPPGMAEAQHILAKCFDIEAKKGAVEAAFGMYALIQSASPEPEMKQKAQGNLDALQGKATFGRSVEKFFKMHSSEGLAVDIGLMFVAAGLGNLAKLRMLAKLEQAGVNGYKAVAIASAVGIGTEATVFWAGGTVKEAMLTDPSKVFTPGHLLKGWGSSLIMIGGLKGAGKLAEGLGPRAAKSLGLVKEGGQQLTFGGKALTWTIGHSAGLGGMIASSHVNQGLGLTPKPLGGWKEGLVNEVFGYVQFAVAHKVADGVVKGKMTEVSKIQHTEIAYKEALLLARGHAETLGFKAERFEVKVDKEGTLSANGKPMTELEPEVRKSVEAQLKKGKDGKIEAQTVFLESADRKLLVGLFLEASLNRPGFSGGKLTKLLEAKDYAKANAYLKEFNLPLHFQKDGSLAAGAAGEPSPHQSVGVSAPGESQPKPPAPDAKAEGGKPAQPAEDAKTERTQEPEEISGSHLVLLEDGMTSEPQRLAARKVTPPAKPPANARDGKASVQAMTPKQPMPEGLRRGLVIPGDGKPMRVDFNEYGVAFLDASGRSLTEAESRKVPHLEIQMALTEDGRILHHARAVGMEKMRIVDPDGTVREVTATSKPLREGDRFRLGGVEYTWFGPHGAEGIEYQTKAVTVFEGRVHLEDTSVIQERRQWAESFAKTLEREFRGHESMFGDPGRALADRVAKDPRMSDDAFRRAFVDRCRETLNALKPVLDKLPEEPRSALAHNFLRQVLEGRLLIGDAQALAASVEAGHLVVEPIPSEQGKAYNYLLVPAFHGVRLPAGAGMLEGLGGIRTLDFGKTVYQVVQFGDATLNFRGGKPQEGRPTTYYVINRASKAAIQIYDPAAGAFRTLPPRTETPIPEGAVLRVGDRSYVFRSPEWVQAETQARNAILAERDLLMNQRAAVQLLPDGASNKASQVERLARLEQDFAELMAKEGRDREGMNGLQAELTHLALSETDFAAAARQALAGKLSAEQYRAAQKEIGKKLVGEHHRPLADVSAFLIGLTKDGILMHRFAKLTDEKGAVSPNPHARLKDPTDIAPKLVRRGWTDLGPLTDVGGARVVVKTTNDVLPIVEAIEAKYKVRPQVTRDGAFELEIIGEEKSAGGAVVSEVTLRPDKDHPDRLTVGTSTGYRAMHVVVEVDGKPIEIQIQTEAIYQWGKIQHSLIYKNKNLPVETVTELNEFCRDVAKYLTDLENGPAAATRPALPLLAKNLTAEARTGLNAELRKMEALMDHYEKVAEDPGEHKTQIFQRPPGAAENAPPPGEKTEAAVPGAKAGANGEGNGNIPQRRALAEELAKPAGLPKAKPAPKAAPVKGGGAAAVQAPKPLPLPSAKGYQQVLDRSDKLGRELVSVVEVSDATLSGEAKHWESSFANSFNPDSTHVTIRGGWRHLSKAEFEAARKAGTLRDTPAGTYEVRILGEERRAQVEARLQKQYGSRLEKRDSLYPSESRWMLRNEKGEAQVEIVLRAKPLAVPTGAEARETYTAFAKDRMPVLAKWLGESSTPRSFYAFRMSQMLGVEGDGRGGYRFGGRFVAALRRFETATDPVAKARAGEELAVMLAYLRDARLLMPEHRILHAANILRDGSGPAKAVAYAMRAGSEWKARGEPAYRAYNSLRELGDRVRRLGEELRRDVSPENQKPGNPVYDEYLQSLHELRRAIKIVHDLETDLKKAGVDLEKEFPPPRYEEQSVVQEVDADMILESSPEGAERSAGPKGRDLHGAEDQPLRDLRQFSEPELELLVSLGLNSSGLRDATHPKFAERLRDALAQLMQHPFKSREYESGVVRLVGALRHWEMFGGRKIPWLDKYLSDHGRDVYGFSKQSMPPPVPPPPRVPLSAEEQQSLGVRELRADNVMQVLSTIRSRSTPMERIGDFIPFNPESGDKSVLRRIMDNYGATVHAVNPKLGMYLQEMFRPHVAYLASLDAKDRGGNGGKLPGRRALEATPPARDVAALGEPTGAYVEKIPLGGSGADLKSLGAPRPTYLGEIPGMTPELAATFDRGGRIEQWPTGRMLVEPSSGADTRVVRPASPAEILAYLRWSQRQGFTRVDSAQAAEAWKKLEGRAQELGVALYLGGEAATGRPEGKALEAFLQENGGQVVFLNALLQKLPASLIAGGGLKKIFLKSPRQEDAHFGAYDAADGSLYLYSGSFQGSRRNLAALFLHEIGHPTAERYRTDAQGDAKIPLKDRQAMHRAHETLARDKALFALDWGRGRADRLKKQAGDFSEFVSDLHVAYVAAGPALRAHIRGLPEGSPAREAWNLVYGELRDRVFGGLEYDFSKLPPPPRPKPGLRRIPGGKAERPLAAIQVPASVLQSEVGPQNAIREERIPGLAAGRDPGVSRYAHNEDRFSVVRFSGPGGKKVTRYFAIDGMGRHAGGEFAAVLAEHVLKEAAARPGVSLEEAIRLADQKMVEHPEHKRLKGNPGAVVVGVEVRELGGDVYELRFADVGDAEAMVFRPDFELQGNAYTARELGGKRKLPRGQTVHARIHPLAARVDQALGGHYPEGHQELRVGTETHRAKKGAIVVAGSDGLTENFISKDEIGDVLRFSGARNAAEMELALRNEALLRMHIRAAFKAEGRFGETITHRDFVAAYRKVWGKNPPPGEWRHEGMTLTELGHVVDMRKDPDTDGISAHFVGHFKGDNVTVIVQRLGEETDGNTPSGVRPDFLPPPLPKVVEIEAEPLSAEGPGR